MSSLPHVTSVECIRALLNLGFTVRRQHGFSVALERPGRIVVVPLGKVLSEEALGLVLLSARVGEEEFCTALTRHASGEHAIALGERDTELDTGERHSRSA